MGSSQGGHDELIQPQTFLPKKNPAERQLNGVYLKLVFRIDLVATGANR